MGVSKWQAFAAGKVSSKYYRCDSVKGSALEHVQPSPARPEPPADWVKGRFKMCLWEEVLKISCSEIPELCDVPEHTGCRKLKMLASDKKHFNVWVSGGFLCKKLEVPLLSVWMPKPMGKASITTLSSFLTLMCRGSHYTILKII